MLSGRWGAAGAASKRVARLPFQTVDKVIPSGDADWATRKQQNFLHSEGLFHSEGMQKKYSFICFVSGNLKELARSNIPNSGIIFL